MRRIYLAMLMAAAAAGFLFAGPAAAQTVTFVDSKDKQTYKTVTIGKQTWMAQNLNYQTDSSWCFENKANNCKKYGRLYDWKTAVTVCPVGWKLPSNQEWTVLVDYLGGREIAGKKLKSKSGWNDHKGLNGNGTDDFGFSALPGSYRSGSVGTFYGVVGNEGRWWTATTWESDADYADSRGMDYGDDMSEYDNKKNDGLSVRCVKE